MPLPSLDQLRALLDERREALEALEIQLGSVALLQPAKDVADDPVKVEVRDPAGRPRAVLVCANPRAPDLVLRGVERAHAARNLLGEELGGVVIEPLLSGRFQELSWVLLPRQRPLSGSVWGWRVQRVPVAYRVLRWLRHALRATRQEVSPEESHRRYRIPLEALVGDKRFSAPLRRGAEQAVARLSAGTWVPRSVLAHNDLWKGNILLPGSQSSVDRSRHGFVLIDWAASDTRGFPIYDLLRVGLSLSLPKAAIRWALLSHCRVLESDPHDASSYLLASLADLDQNRGCFPEDRYLELAHRLYGVLASLIST